MTDRVSRRQLLAAGAVGSSAAAAGCSTFGGGDTERAELLERVRELRAAVDECNSDREMLRALELEARSLDDEPFFDADVAASVRETVLPLRQSVVKMRVDHPHYEGEQSGATGWVYADGLVATNKHVADPRGPEGYELLGIETFDGERRDGEVVEAARSGDIALVAVSTDGMDPLPVGSSEDLAAADPVVSVGNPRSVGDWVLSLRSYLGEFAERSFVAEGPSVDGMSGSPVVDADGTVVGMQRAGGVPETMPAFVDTAVEESDFAFPDRLSRSSAVFERYTPRGYISCVGIEHVVETFERWV